MICSNCGKEVPDTAKVCGYCGQRLNDLAHTPRKAQERAPDARRKEVKPASSQKQGKKLPRWVWITGGVVLVVVVLLFVLGSIQKPVVQAMITVEPGDPDKTGPQYGMPTLDDLTDDNGVANIKVEQAVNIGGGYCPASAEIMEKTSPFLTISYSFDGVSLPAENFVSKDWQFERRYCRLFYGVVRSWSPGEHEYRFRVTTSTEINDGFNTYPPGVVWEQVVKINVTE